MPPLVGAGLVGVHLLGVPAVDTVPVLALVALLATPLALVAAVSTLALVT